MELSNEVFQVLRQAMQYAMENKFEYVTPEIVLLSLTKNSKFKTALESCGGNTYELSRNLLEYMENYMEKLDDNEASEADISFSNGVNNILSYAGRSAASSGNKEIFIRHIVNGMWKLHESYAVYFMEKQGVLKTDLLHKLTVIDQEGNTEKKETEKSGKAENSAENETKEWEQYAPCLNDSLKNINPLIGRETELDRTIQILCRKDKNNPLHIGEPGVGKTAVTYGLVQRIREGKVPKQLLKAKVFELDLGGMLAGTQYRGDFEKRLKSVLSEIGKEEMPVIYIDEIHNISGAGAGGSSSFDASNMLKPYLSEGHIRFIGATTFEEYKKYFEKNKSVIRRFQNVEITEPDKAEAVRILEGLKSRYEEYHNVRYDHDIMEYAVHMSSKYINERFLPDKAIDLIDEAGSYRKLHPLNKDIQLVDKEVINEILVKICRVPVETVKTDDNEGLFELDKKLKSKIFGQNEAINQVVNAVKFSKAGLLDENKPLASLLFVGPTGVGKTEIAKSLADELGVKLIRFDMSEYGEKHAVAKLIGSPAGYVGYEDGGLLTEAVRKTPSAVLLLDEIEKAHSDIYNILLQVMDYATLTDNQGRKADFRNIIVIMTSNAGANRLGKQGIGFISTSNNSSVIDEAVKQTFQPEFRNRLNKIVVFNNMDDEMSERIVEKKLNELSLQLSAKNIIFSADKSASDLIKKRGISNEFGAREVDRVIRNDVKSLFVDDILFGQLKHGGKLFLSADDDAFVTTVEK